MAGSTSGPDAREDPTAQEAEENQMHEEVEHGAEDEGAEEEGAGEEEDAEEEEEDQEQEEEEVPSAEEDRGQDSTPCTQEAPQPEHCAVPTMPPEALGPKDVDAVAALDSIPAAPLAKPTGLTSLYASLVLPSGGHLGDEVASSSSVCPVQGLRVLAEQIRSGVPGKSVAEAPKKRSFEDLPPELLRAHERKAKALRRAREAAIVVQKAAREAKIKAHAEALAAHRAAKAKQTEASEAAATTDATQTAVDSVAAVASEPDACVTQPAVEEPAASQAASKRRRVNKKESVCQAEDIQPVAPELKVTSTKAGTAKVDQGDDPAEDAKAEEEEEEEQEDEDEQVVAKTSNSAVKKRPASAAFSTPGAAGSKRVARATDARKAVKPQPALLEKPEEQQVPLASKPKPLSKLAKEERHFLSLSDSARIKYLSKLSLPQQMRLAKALSLAEGGG